MDRLLQKSEREKALEALAKMKELEKKYQHKLQRIEKEKGYELYCRIESEEPKDIRPVRKKAKPTEVKPKEEKKEPKQDRRVRKKRIPIGARFGRLTVLEVKGAVVKCKCDCGTICEKMTTRVRTGKTRSCGCLRQETAKNKGKKKEKK